MTHEDLEIELAIAEETIREAEESFDLLRKDYHALREHTDKLEALLKTHNIDYPHFWGF